MNVKILLSASLIFSTAIFNVTAQSQKDLENALKQAIIQGVVNSVVGTDNTNQSSPPPNSGYRTGNEIGAIHFTDGSIKSFRSISGLYSSPSKDAPELSWNKDGILVFYQNSYHTIPWDNLSTMSIVPENIRYTSVSGQLDINTKNGIALSTPITIGYISVTVYDNLSNGYSLQNYQSALQSNQLISWIEFF